MQVQPFAPDRGKMPTAVDDRNGLAGKGEVYREEAADRAGANDADFHLTPPNCSLACRSTHEHSRRLCSPAFCMLVAGGLSFNPLRARTHCIAAVRECKGASVGLWCGSALGVQAEFPGGSRHSSAAVSLCGQMATNRLSYCGSTSWPPNND